MAIDFDGDPGAEMTHLVTHHHVDGFFTDCPSTVEAWWRAQQYTSRPPAGEASPAEHDSASHAGSSFLSQSANRFAVAMLTVGVALCIVATVLAIWVRHVHRRASAAGYSAPGGLSPRRGAGPGEETDRNGHDGSENEGAFSHDVELQRLQNDRDGRSDRGF